MFVKLVFGWGGSLWLLQRSQKICRWYLCTYKSNCSGMAYYKKEDNGKWSVQFRYKDHAGISQRKRKLGFSTKKEATEWMNEFIRKAQADMQMTFDSFVEEYFENVSADLRESTLDTKKHIIDLHIRPYFKDRDMAGIEARDIIKWQNQIKKKGFSDSYLSTIHGQLSAIFNHACKLYHLPYNPCKEAGGMGNKKSGNRGIWSQEEMEKFLEAVSDKVMVKYAFFLMYWTGIRLGELLALTVEDLDLEEKMLRINKSLNRVKGVDILTLPKTDCSIRTIYLPQFVVDEMQEYCNKLYGRTKQDRLFPLTKSRLEKEIKRGADIAGLKSIRVHDLRHSHASLLISQGINIATISKRLGHENIQTTLKTYAHMFDADAKEAAITLDKLYSKEEEDN